MIVFVETRMIKTGKKYVLTNIGTHVSSDCTCKKPEVSR